MKLRVSFALVIFALLFTNLCYAQIADYNFLGGGARARAMGGAFFAVSDDPSAGSWNPAGLSQLDLPQTNLTFYSGRVKVGHKFGDISRETKTSNDLILSGAVVIPFKVGGYQMVGSVSYERLSVFSDQSYYYFAFSDDRTEEISGNVDAVTLSLGREFLKGFSAGMAVNIYTGGQTQKASQFLSYVASGDSGIFYHPLVKGDYSGFNLHFGTMFKVQNFSFGAVVKTPFKLKEKIDAKMEYDIVLGDYVNPRINQPWGYYYNTKNEWKLPLIWGIGSAFKTGDLIISVDIEYRDFSKTELTYQRHPYAVDTTEAYAPNINSPTKTVDLDWEKGTQFRIGGEYIVHTKLGKIPLRAGYRNDPKVFTSVENVTWAFDSYMGDLRQFDEGSKGGKVEGSVISFGTGIAWEQIMFDITYEYSQYDYSSDGSTGYLYYNEDEEQLEVLYKLPFEDKITNKDSRIMVGFTGYF
ncbi:MAG: hypothetical protein MUO85_10790 [candidate division Zixibacteria bacterium]|nr:hypothetical protein [candidate division Zixibacteria bacterium]